MPWKETCPMNERMCFVAAWLEGEETKAALCREGVDELIRSVEENQVPRNSDVYAELGSTWRYAMRDPDSAAHILGKLVKHIGEEDVLYGSDCIWYGSPQDQIQAFRAFQISEALQERHGYARMTPELRARIFGLNAAKPYGIDVDEVLERAPRRHRAAARGLSGERRSPLPDLRPQDPARVSRPLAGARRLVSLV